MAARTSTRRRFLAALGLGALVPITDFPDWAAPQANADTISTTGAPPLVMKRVLDALIGQSIGSVSSITRPASGKFAVNQPGYEIQLNVGTLGGTSPIMSVELQWYDSAFNALIDAETYWFYSGNVNGHQVHGRGPSRGDQLVVVISNVVGAASVSVSYTMLQTSRTFTREFWKTIAKGGVQPVYAGFTAATSDLAANVLANDSHTLGALGAASVILPLYTGSARLFAATGDTTAGNSVWSITTTSDNLVASAIPFQGANGQSGFAPNGVKSLYAPYIALPRSQCTLQLTNGNATTTETLTAAVIAQEDRA